MLIYDVVMMQGPMSVLTTTTLLDDDNGRRCDDAGTNVSVNNNDINVSTGSSVSDTQPTVDNVANNNYQHSADDDSKLVAL